MTSPQPTIAPSSAPSSHRAARRARCGAILSMELVLVLPIVMAVLLAIIEMSLLWSAQHRVKEASTAGCRIASLPGGHYGAVQHAVRQALGKQQLVEHSQVFVQGGQRSGDDVIVTVEVPMSAASPDLMAMFGFSVRNRKIVAQTVMRRE